MAAEFIVAGRIELPPGDGVWDYVLKNDEGGLEVYEAAARYDSATLAEQSKWVADVVGWAPRSIVFVRKAWELGQVVAEELARALDGIVFCDVDGVVFFDGHDQPAPAASRRALEDRLAHSFNNPQSFFARQDSAEKARFEAELNTDPATADANDWSDI